MDLRPHVKTRHVKKAKELVIRGLMQYQPFIFSDDLQTGAGYEFLSGGEFSGMVCWPTIDRQLLKTSPELARWIVADDKKAPFADANRRLAAMYDSFVEGICAHLGDVSSLSFAEVGCNAGYFPVSFCLRQARSAVGFDRENYGESVALLNDILGTQAKFVHRGYDGKTQSIPRAGTFDVVLSVAVLCHLSDPLQHLACLGSMSAKALFVWTPVANDDDYVIRFGEPNKYYKADSFPFCFDNMVRPSRKMLRKCLEVMGFTRQHELPNTPGAMPDSFYRHHIALLGIRP